MTPIRLVYIAGPYRGSDIQIRANVTNAEMIAEVIIANAPNLLPIVPHSIGRRYEHIRPDHDFWLPATLALMERCDAVYLLPGWERSEGTMAERARAMEMGLPVFVDPDALFAWGRA
jgi:hypothetical protein